MQPDDVTPEFHPQPMVVLLTAACTGIVLDRVLVVPSTVAWGSSLLLALSLPLLLRLDPRFSFAALMLGIACAAGAWHHLCWFEFSRGEIGRRADRNPRPVCLEGVACANPERVPAPPDTPLRTIPQGEGSRLLLEVRGVRDGATWRPAAGRCELSIDGHLLGVAAGDRIRVFGQLTRITARGNPGEFDLAAHRRADRVLCRLHAASPACVRRVGGGSHWSPHTILGKVRAAARRQLTGALAPEHAGLAGAVLLGARDGIDTETRDAFFRTGSLHLLAISGLHLGILVLLLWGLLRWIVPSERAALWLLIAVTLGYCLLVEARPPVLRATLLVVTACIARLLRCEPLSFNLLAAAGLVVLAVNPADLFRTGTQLSFIAVATLVRLAPWFAPRRIEDPLDRLLARVRPWPWRFARSTAEFLGRLWLTGAAVWLATLPLVAFRFHLVPFSGLLLNLLLWIPTTLALWSGFLLMTLGWLLPPLAPALGWCTEQSFALLSAIIESASRWSWGARWVAGPPGWWVGLFYAALGVLFAIPAGRLPRRWLLAGAGVLCALGLWGADPFARDSAFNRGHLAITFLNVGHGTAVLLELPDGRALLYDAGSLGAPETAERAVSGALWAAGRVRLEAVIVSHADADHYNAIPGLLQRFTMGEIYVSPVMFEQIEENPALAELWKAGDRAGVPIRWLHHATPANTFAGVRLSTLHPPERGVQGSDNANSIVLLIEYAGRRVLLPGDLEGVGMADLLAEEPLDCDLVMAPHHGSSGSHPAGFTAWCAPEFVVISGGASIRGAGVKGVRALFEAEGRRTWHTAESGAVRFTIAPTGEIAVRVFGEEPPLDRAEGGG